MVSAVDHGVGDERKRGVIPKTHFSGLEGDVKTDTSGVPAA